MKRALSVAQCLSMRDDPLPMSPLWRAAVGEPELGTVWMVWGASGSGKTSFALALCKEMCRMGYRVAYDTMEEGASKSFSDALVRERMDECGRRFVVLDNMPMDELAAWMERRRSADGGDRQLAVLGDEVQGLQDIQRPVSRADDRGDKPCGRQGATGCDG